MAKYDRIGLTYNQTRKADPFLVRRMIELLNPKTGEQFLDIGCGTGNYTLELVKQNVKIIGIDPSNEMLQQASVRNKEIDWIQGIAEDIKLADKSQDGVLAWLTTHHWTDIDQGLNESYRILRPGGRLLIFTSTPEQMEQYWLHHYFPKMMAASGRKMLSQKKLTSSLTKAGFTLKKTEPYFVRTDLQDLFLQCGKTNPEIYFKEEIRNGISSFADVANAEEVEKGLQKLRKDIDTGAFDELVQRYADKHSGDYLFLLAVKQYNNQSSFSNK
jgi:ubiquinone/menaquinone biosynthesis C-methylase UbiE